MKKYPDARNSIDQEIMCRRKMFRNLGGNLPASTSHRKENEGFRENRMKSLEDDPETELPDRKSRNRMEDTMVPVLRTQLV